MVDSGAPNIFILLGLDPEKPWNQVEFERLLEEKRREWARLVNRPDRKGLEAKQNIGLIAEIKRIAGDETLRQSLAEAAKQERFKQRAGKLQKLDENLALLQARGHILQEEFDQLLKTYGDVLSEIELRKRVNVPIKKTSSDEKQQKEILDPHIAKEISKRLQGLKKTSLYDFLGLDENIEHSLLIKKADSLYRAVTSKGVKSPEDTLIEELCGYCTSIFKSQKERAKYDESLRLIVYEETKQNVDLVAQFTRKVNAHQIEKILRDARQNGLDPKETLYVIEEYAAQKKYVIEIPEGLVDRARELRRCGYCKTLNDAKSDFCTICSKPLQDPCPKCNGLVQSDDMACGSCGFPTGNRVYVSLLLNDAEESGKNFDYLIALEQLEQARQVWPVDGKEPISRKIRELTEKIKRGFDAQKVVIEQIETTVKQRQFYAARDLLPSLIKVLPKSGILVEEYRRKVNEAIHQAEKLLGQARGINPSDSEKLVFAYQAVLAICQDCQEARKILARTPPSPPTNLQASVSGKLIHLSWSQSPSQNIRYSIVRKVGSRPESAESGNQIDVISGTTYDDITGEVGIPYFFTIFTNREGVYSRDGATLNSPVYLIDEVENLCALVSNHQVSLTWKNPPNVSEIIIVRSEKNFPTTQADGQQILLVDKNQALDNQVQNDEQYFYTIFCQFKDISGRTIISHGKNIKAIPQTPPAPIQEMQINASGGPNSRRLQFKWPPILKGDAVLLKSSVSTGLKNEMVIPGSELAQYGQILNASSENATDEINQLGLYYYLPVVLFQGMAYIGKEYKFASVDDISSLSAQNLGHVIRLQWQWPPNCNEAIVKFSYDGWPESEQGDFNTMHLTHAQYGLNGSYDIQKPVIADHYIIVYAVIGQGEQKIVASGQDAGARKLVSLRSRIIVEYEIKPSLLKKIFSLNVNINGQGNLPEMVLVRKYGALPMSKSDGDLVVNLKTQEVENNKIRIQIPNRYNQRQSFAKLFLQDESLYEVVIIRHPSVNKLRLF